MLNDVRNPCKKCVSFADTKNVALTVKKEKKVESGNYMRDRTNLRSSIAPSTPYDYGLGE